MRTALIQMSCSQSPQDNLAKAIEKIRQASKKGAQVICLQELFLYPYFCQKVSKAYFKLAEKIPGVTTKIFSDIARKEKVVIIAPIFEKGDAKSFYNTAVVIDADGRLLGKYRKSHIPYDPLFYEKPYFHTGNLGIKVFQTRYAKIAPLICYDQWFPEAARVAAIQGAQILYFPTAIGWKPERKKEMSEYRSSWQCIQRGHAIANGVFVAAVNRVGQEGRLQFWGNSFVADPFGKILGEASSSKDEILLIDCDLKRIQETRRAWPFFRDRRVDIYKKILSRGPRA